MKDRIVFVDYVRVIACFLVMLVHSSECFYCTSFDTAMLASESNRLWVSLYDGGIGRISVPLFMLISAFLLVPMKPGTTMVDFYKRRFARILPPMVFFLLLYTFLPCLFGWISGEQMCHELLMLPFNFPSSAGHLWFMYPLISLYLIIPIVSPWLEKATAREERLFLSFFVLSTFVPWLTRFVSADLWGTCHWNPYFGALYYCSGYLGYLVMAHYIRVHLDWNKRKRMCVGLVALILGGSFSAWSFYHTGVPGVEMHTPVLEWGWPFCTPNVLLATFGAFLLLTCIEQAEAPRWLTDLSKLTFGMYLMHLLFLNNIAPLIIGEDVSNPIVPVALAIPCIAVLTFTCSALTTKLISLIPGSKWVIG